MNLKSPTADHQTGNNAFREVTLLKALMEAARRLGLNTVELGEILGVSQGTISKMRASLEGGAAGPRIKAGSKTWDLAVHVIRIYRSLNALVGGNDQEARLWFDGAVAGLQGQRPREAVRTVEGLICVGQYLDAYRARV